KRLFVIYTSFQPTIAKNHGQNASIYLDELKAEWTKQFIAENLTVDDIKTGLERARLSKSEFMPKCSTFIDWCKGVDEQALNKSWQHYVNRRIGQEWSDAMTFETAKRLGCGCNELIANQCNNNAEKAKKLFADKYNEILTDIKNGFKLPELALVIEHKAGSNQNRSKQDKQRIEQKKAEFESGKPLEKRGKFNPDGWLMLKTGVWYKFHNGAKIHYVEESGMVHLNGKQIEISEFQKGVE
ncbi:MAG: hypothetical protein CMI54_01370, partial [Parcubacteria group bacterium]|nr:hypothetical protein [Parcubacteria group bacterium]